MSEFEAIMQELIDLKARIAALEVGNPQPVAGDTRSHTEKVLDVLVVTAGWVPTAKIAHDAGISPSAVRQVLYHRDTRHLFQRRQKHPQARATWRLAPDNAEDVKGEENVYATV